MTQPGSPRSLDYRRNEVESYVANAHRGVNAVALSTVPFVFRDRDQYIQSSETPSVTPQTPSTILDISLHDHGEPSNHRSSTLSDEALLHAPSFPQPECSCEPSSIGNQPSESRSSLPYVQENPEPSLPQTLHSHQQPEFSDGTVDDHGSNVPSTVTSPVASSSTNTTRGIVLNDPATVTNPAANSDTSSLNTGTAGGQITPTRRLPGAFGTGQIDPFAIRKQYAIVVEQEPVVEVSPEPKKTVWGKISKLLS
jgi:hypothetical protein